MPEQRRFPPPWSVEETDACLIVRDHGGQGLAYVCFEEGEAGRRAAARLLTYDEARRIDANIAKLPELLRRGAALDRSTSTPRASSSKTRVVPQFESGQNCSDFLL
jgi:hypothetical protein